MMTTGELTIFDDALKITEKYLGPAAKRFIERQIAFHLNKKPQELTKDDIPKLLEWVKVSLGLLTEDKNLVDSFTAEFEKLAQ